MERFLRITILSLALIIISIGAACATAPDNTANTNSTTTANTTTTAATTASPQPTPQPTNNATNATDLPVTLPVLDAFFADETFTADLKSKLNLNDEQIGKLRTIAREQTSTLRESDTDNYNGTTTAASAHAAEQIKGVIGAEKTEQLLALVRQRWNGDDTASPGSAANNAPINTNASALNSSAGTDTNTTNSSARKFNGVPTDTRIVVNAPAYRMDIFDNGKLTKSYKVGIGYPEFPLPTGLRKASSIIVNPTWTPPDEPWVASSNKVKAGQKVEAGSKLNPLGPIKIPIGLPSLIHGGKSPAKLGSFASHGCVGLTSPQVEEVALKIAQIGGADLNQEKLAEFMKDKTETKNVKLNSAVPVELRYETLVVEDGKLHVYRDVYDKGTNTEANLRAVLDSYGASFDQLSEQERAQALNALKQMSRDANGNPTGGAGNAKTDAPSGNKNSSGKNSKVESDKVTRAVKGQKEIVVPIAALAGKGYPAPVDLNTGGATKTAANNARPPARKKR
ncbi:MAG: L,D-transpeptidase [Pyrinomonadaceae bacterium]